MNLTDLKTYGPEVKFPQAGKCLKRSRCGHQCGSEGSAQPRGTEERLKSDGISYLQAPGDMPGRTHRHWPAVTSMMAMGGGHLRGEAVSMSPPACSLPSPRRTPMCSPIPLCSCLQVGGAELSPIKSLTTSVWCVVSASSEVPSDGTCPPLPHRSGHQRSISGDRPECLCVCSQRALETVEPREVDPGGSAGFPHSHARRGQRAKMAVCWGHVQVEIPMRKRLP